MNKLSLCEAIARMEGWLVQDSRCRRNHNPGNIRYGTFAKSHNAIGTDGAFAIFKDDATGFLAMSDLLIACYAGDTITQALFRYAPSTENNTQNYIANICDWTGYSPTTVLTTFMLKPPGGINESPSIA